MDYQNIPFAIPIANKYDWILPVPFASLEQKVTEQKNHNTIYNAFVNCWKYITMPKKSELIYATYKPYPRKTIKKRPIKKRIVRKHPTRKHPIKKHLTRKRSGKKTKNAPKF
jgi:hypothetical protein